MRRSFTRRELGLIQGRGSSRERSDSCQARDSRRTGVVPRTGGGISTSRTRICKEWTSATP
jgi:hypothetical protein